MVRQPFRVHGVVRVAEIAPPRIKEVRKPLFALESQVDIDLLVGRDQAMDLGRELLGDVPATTASAVVPLGILQLREELHATALLLDRLLRLEFSLVEELR